MMTDILVAQQADIPAIVAQWPGSKNWPSLQTTGLDSLVLADLATALDQASLAQAIEELGPSPMTDTADGPWVYVLPAELRDRIADVPEDRLIPIAKAWSKGEESSARGLTVEAAQRLLSEIITLARKAREDHKPMLLWISS